MIWRQRTVLIELVLLLLLKKEAALVHLLSPRQGLQS
jgi:hypothetical protein